MRFDEIKTFLFENHQKLLLCAGFSDALQESLMTTEEIRAANVEPPVFQQGFYSAVEIVSKSVELALTKFRKISHDELQSKGLSAFDQFYADVSVFILVGFFLSYTLRFSNRLQEFMTPWNMSVL